MEKTKNEIDNDLFNEMLGRSTTQAQSDKQTVRSKPSTCIEDYVNTISEHDLKFENHSTDLANETLKRPRGKQLKTSFEEYRQQFLQVPKITDRKPVFVSSSTRDLLDRLVRKLGERKMSVSGLIENLALHHLKTYEEDIEQWRKL